MTSSLRSTQPHGGQGRREDECSSESPMPLSDASLKAAAKRGKPGSMKASGQLSNWPEDRNLDQWWLYQMYLRWTYSYMAPILCKGAQKQKERNEQNGESKQQQQHVGLTADDLYPIPATMQSRHLSDQFWKYFDARRRSQSQLVRILFRMASPTFVPAGVCQLIAVLMNVTLPLIVRQLLIIMEENPGERVVEQGLPYAVSIFLCLVVHGLAFHRHRHLAMKSGVLLRAAVVNILFEQVLKLTPRGRIGLTPGQLATVVAVDTQKLYEVTQEGHLLWSLPLSIILVTICLVLIMGPVTLVGIGVLVAFVPVVERITSAMLKIRQQRASSTDQRVGIIHVLLQGIQVTKLSHYEDRYFQRIKEAREREMHSLRRELALWASTLFVMVLSPVLATAATFSVYVLLPNGNVLTAAMSFSVLLLFSALRFPINYAGRLAGKLAQALSAVHRIDQFLQRETRAPVNCTYSLADQVANHDRATDDDTSHVDNNFVSTKYTGSPMLILENASFIVGNSPLVSSAEANNDNNNSSGDNVEMGVVNDSAAFTVSGFDVSIRKGEVVAVCGPVGSGKSSLIHGIIDELPVASKSATIECRGNVAYVPQTPFILNATLRENILFGLPFERDVYERVLDACCLRQDLQQLGASRDMTEIGERGVTLSGGQKQRISLARAAYARPDLVLLDDPLSALDAGTAKDVFKRLIKSQNALFSDIAVLLVTHASHFLNRVDSIIVVVAGAQRFSGTWKDLTCFQSSDSRTMSAIDFIRSSVQEDNNSNVDEIESESLTNDTALGVVSTNPIAGALMTTEEREHGQSSPRTWLKWFIYAGGFTYIGILALFMVGDRFAYVATEYWLARWTSGAEEPVIVFGKIFPPQTDGRSAQYQYLKVYAIILLVSSFFTFIRSEWCVTGGMRASDRVFNAMLRSVLASPISYFESTPIGRILNRFTYDIEVMDIILTQNMGMLLLSFGWFATGVTIMLTILPWVGLAVVPVSLTYWILVLHYRKSGPDLQRIDAMSRSPVQAMVAEGLDGATTIRVFRKEANFIAKYRVAVDQNSSALLNFVTAQRWIGVRIEVLGSIVALAATVLIVCLNEVLTLEPGIVGLLISWSVHFTIILGFLIDAFSEAESAVTAVERVDAMGKLPSEKPMNTDSSHELPLSWPSEGRLVFQDVTLRYRTGLPLALNKLTITIPPGKSVGVVGRTGAGKSSLAVALFRLVEIESGRICLDGVDLAQIGLADVRGRKNGMFIIPQNPFLAGTTLRECLDPFDEYQDDAVLEALTAVRLASLSDDVGVLSTEVEEGGSNYSVGEKQLLNLARAFLSKPILLVLDEATASVDGETDSFIQQMIRTYFSNTTLITVAHRLNTIMDNDLILVMGDGKVLEFDTPTELLSRKGAFAELVDSTGPESAKTLRSIADGSSIHLLDES